MYQNDTKQNEVKTKLNHADMNFIFYKRFIYQSKGHMNLITSSFLKTVCMAQVLINRQLIDEYAGVFLVDKT